MRAAVLVVLALLLAAGCGPSVPPRIVLLGDSITWGVVSGPEGPAFEALLGAQLGDAVEIENVSCGGLTVAVWLADATPAFCHKDFARPNLFAERLQPLLPAAVVVVLLGTNDSIHLGGQVEPKVYGERLRRLTRQIVEHGAERVVLRAPPFIKNKPKSSVRLRAYGEHVAAICEERAEVVCGPDLYRVLDAGDFAKNDLHPNARGHARIAAGLEATLRPLMGLDSTRPE